MRGFMILGALSALTRGAELPATPDATTKDVAYLYYTGQMPTTDALPSAWTGTCSTGTKQSPIDVTTANLVVESTDPGEIMLTGHDIQLTGSVRTDGRQIYYVPTAPLGFRPILSGGALSSSKIYVFDHFEFKFGKTSATGSEHTIDTKQYPMEIQFVYFDQTTHADAATAGAHANADSVVVVSYLVETDTTDNTALTDVLTAITQAGLKPGTGNIAKSETGKTVTLKTLMGNIDSIKDYYYYAGSQTSSNCEENVKWIIATEKLKISTTQLALFPLLYDETSSTTSFVYNNYRPVTGDSITVMHRKDETKKSETYEDAANILGASVVGITAFELFRNFLTQPETAKALKSNPILDLIEDFDQKFLNGEEEQQQQQQQFQPQQFQSQQFQQRY